MKIIECPQLSEEWWMARRGRPSASNFSRIMTPAKKQYSAQARKYACELVAEMSALVPPWLTGRGPVRSADMDWGVQTEAEARRFYEMERNVTVREVGLCVTDDNRFCCSPDGLVNEDGGLELKAPLLATQAEYLDNGGVPSEYLCQVHGSLIVTGRAWWDFMSYAPGLPALLVRVVPNEFTEMLRKCLDQFYDEFMELDKKIRGEKGDVF